MRSSLVRLVRRRLLLIKCERKYIRGARGGFSLEPHTSRAQMAISDTRHGPRYAAFAVARASVTICYPSSIKSLLHQLKISSCTPSSAISESEVARYCNLTYDPALPTQLYLNTRNPAVIAISLSSRSHDQSSFLTLLRARFSGRSEGEWKCTDEGLDASKCNSYAHRVCSSE